MLCSFIPSPRCGLALLRHRMQTAETPARLDVFVRHVCNTQNAFKSYVRMRDYCSTPAQMTAMCLAVIKVRLRRV